MNYFLLPRINTQIYKYIDYIESESLPEFVISNSLANYLCEIKKKIDVIENDWNTFKKYTNTYEYINTTVPYRKKSVSIQKPLSRSYYKMIEIIYTFGIYFDDYSIQSFHLAEGPGGFIEALLNYRKCPDDKYIGMTLLDNKNDNNIPAWKQSERFLKSNKNVYIEHGADNTGNILSFDNFVYCAEKYASKMDFITADGGFDFSTNFNEQEYTVSQLIFAQICYALVMQKQRGTFVLKIFDCFLQSTIDMLYILSSFYEKVYIYKPNTSRTANSEKYIVCKGFIYYKYTLVYPYLQNIFNKMVNTKPDASNPSNIFYVSRFLNLEIPSYFLSKLEEYNAIIGQKQIENIYDTISLIDNKHKQEKIDKLINSNIQKCIHWCIKHDIEYNNL